MRKTIHTTLIILLLFGIAWAAPKYRIDSGSDMSAPPAIGAVTPNAGHFTTLEAAGGFSGNASTATALAANPADCSAGQFANAIAANGDLTCAVPTGGGSPDWANPGAIGSVTPNTIKGTTIESTTGLTIDAGGIASTDTVAAGGSGIAGYADSGAAISSGDRLGYYFLGGAKDNAHSMDNAAGMSAYATQNWSGSAAGTKLQFEVTPNGSTTRATAVTIDQDSTATFVTSKHTSEYATSFNARTVYTEKGAAENGDLYGFIGSGQSSFVKSGPAGYVLTSQGVGSMPAWREPLFDRSMSIGTLDISNGGPTSTSVTCGFAPRLATFRIGFFEGSNTGLEYASGVGWTDFSSVWSEATRNTYSAGYHEFGASTAFVQLYQSGGSIYSTSVTQGANGFTVNWTHGGASGTANWMALCFR